MIPQIDIPPIALALRITVEVFRVLSQDQNKLSAITLIDYFNKTELIPMTISQLLDLFQIFSPVNIQSLELLKVNRKGMHQSEEELHVSENRLMLRTYQLLDFI